LAGLGLGTVTSLDVLNHKAISKLGNLGLFLLGLLLLGLLLLGFSLLGFRLLGFRLLGFRLLGFGRLGLGLLGLFLSLLLLVGRSASLLSSTLLLILGLGSGNLFLFTLFLLFLAIGSSSYVINKRSVCVVYVITTASQRANNVPSRLAPFVTMPLARLWVMSVMSLHIHI
jgi:hypothetical protein